MLRMLWLAGTLALAFLVLWLLVRASEARLAFFPEPGEDTTPASYGAAFTPITITTSDGERLQVWHLTLGQPRARVVYFHGNGGNLSVWTDVLARLALRGYEVVAFDYRGYGLSTGSPSEQGLYRDAEAVLALVHDRLRRFDVPVVYWGRSLGSTVAAYAAARRAPDGVVLEAGFPSLRAVVRGNRVLWALSWFSSYEFPTQRFLTEVHVPVLVMHGNRDSVIPFALGQELHAALRGPKQFLTIEGGDHNDAVPPDAAAYWSAVDGFVAAISSSRPR